MRDAGVVGGAVRSHSSGLPGQGFTGRASETDVFVAGDELQEGIMNRDLTPGFNSWV